MGAFQIICRPEPEDRYGEKVSASQNVRAETDVDPANDAKVLQQTPVEDASSGGFLGAWQGGAENYARWRHSYRAHLAYIQKYGVESVPTWRPVEYQPEREGHPSSSKVDHQEASSLGATDDRHKNAQGDLSTSWNDLSEDQAAHYLTSLQKESHLQKLTARNAEPQHRTALDNFGLYPQVSKMPAAPDMHTHGQLTNETAGTRYHRNTVRRSSLSSYPAFLTGSLLALDAPMEPEDPYEAYGCDEGFENGDEVPLLAKTQIPNPLEGHMLQAGLHSRTRREEDLESIHHRYSPLKAQIETAETVSVRRHRVRKITVEKNREVSALPLEPLAHRTAVSSLKGKLSKCFSRKTNSKTVKVART